MAQKKTTRKKRPLQPEEVILARAKPKSITPKAPPKKSVKKPKKHPIHWRKYARLRVRKDVFYSLISIVLAIVVVFTWMHVSESVRDIHNNLNASTRTANATFLVAKKEADVIRVIGTKLQRQSEIKNYQSATPDLQKFVSSDYRTFKQQCIANGTLSDDVGYEVSSVIYDAYAVVKRTCNGGTDTAILKKFNDKWALVFSGNVYPPCSTLNDLNIPQGASYYCTQNDVPYINPNP